MSNGGDLRSAMDVLNDIMMMTLFNQRQKYLYTFYATNKGKVNTICRNACTGVYAFDSTTECLFVYVVCREIEWHKN